VKEMIIEKIKAIMQKSGLDVEKIKDKIHIYLYPSKDFYLGYLEG